MDTVGLVFLRFLSRLFIGFVFWMTPRILNLEGNLNYSLFGALLYFLRVFSLFESALILVDSTT